MTPYDAPANWPVMPKGIAHKLILRFDNYADQYGLRWKALYNAGKAPEIPDAEVYEAARSTLETYWDLPEQDPERAEAIAEHVLVNVDGGGYDWLFDRASGEDLNFYFYLNDASTPWPPPLSAFSGSHSQIAFTFLIWRMFLLQLTEEILSCTCKNWRANLGVPV